MNFTLTDLGMAYRMAKVDLYYTTNPPILKIAEYEEDLVHNLLSLLYRLNSPSDDWVEDPDYLGGRTFFPKSLKISPPDASNVVHSNPARIWGISIENSESAPIAEFRLSAMCSIDFHIISTLWMMRVGKKFDKCLSATAYGNRLRKVTPNAIEDLSLGSFNPYTTPFGKWRDDGLKSMTEALEEDKEIVAITADVTTFYHQLDPSFMTDKNFVHKTLGINLTAKETKLNRVFIKSIHAWTRMVEFPRGLPVGLPASAVIANMALIELDRTIEEEIVPIYYGRYVDDIILVIENRSKMATSSQIWNWIISRSDRKLVWDEAEAGSISYTAEYLEGSDIRFSNRKNKIFFMEGDSGKVLISSIRNSIYERASEWRSLPVLPSNPEKVATDMVAATQSDGESADNLRKTDSVSMRRAGFALKLRDIEAYERDLEPKDWIDHRRAFYRAFIDHVLVLPNFFDLAGYLPRIIQLATSCKDFEEVGLIIRSLNNIVNMIAADCKIIASSDAHQTIDGQAIISEWTTRLFSTIYENIASAFPGHLSSSEAKNWNRHIEEPTKSDPRFPSLSIQAIELVHKSLFYRDLAHAPYRFSFLPEEFVARRGIEREFFAHPFDRVAPFKLSTLMKLLKKESIAGLQTMSEWNHSNPELFHSGIAFPTRPFSFAELFIIAGSPFSKESNAKLIKVIGALRGWKPTGMMPNVSENDPHLLKIQSGSVSTKKRIAISSWKTEYDSWIAAAMKLSDPDVDRYRRLNSLINEVISRGSEIDYLILPELALPSKWFIRIAQKLHDRGINLITGMEYFHSKNKNGEKVVHNQVWAALGHDGLGFPSTMIVRQDKQRAALHEEQTLHSYAGLRLEPKIQTDSPTVIQNGNFSFAMLICSELTNINYRSDLRGKVDALFVPEWNRDITTFVSLIESASLDIHAYIIQCNDGAYGDSRIRAPYSETWRRDIVKVKGGVHDYVVVGEIDIESLRQFHSHHRSPAKPFKPVPDGFSLSPGRRSLPRSGKDRTSP
ncbi:reverse transcriptase [Rhodococcus erythropolis]|nr:Reverse transcriptase [Rhodococcus erythropolis]MDO1490736.1 reverse transcriptase [Rhodococcus erythropolis]